MDNILVLITVLVIWNVALTAACLVAIRQVTVLGMRERSTPPGSQGGELLALNKPLPNVVTDAISTSREGAVALLFLSTACDHCRRVAQQCADRADDSFNVVVVVPGREGASDWLRTILPTDIQVLTGPVADSIRTALSPLPAPFVVFSEAGLIRGWMQVGDWSEVKGQILQSRVATREDSQGPIHDATAAQLR